MNAYMNLRVSDGLVSAIQLLRAPLMSEGEICAIVYDEPYDTLQDQEDFRLSLRGQWADSSVAAPQWRPGEECWIGSFGRNAGRKSITFFTTLERETRIVVECRVPLELCFEMPEEQRAAMRLASVAQELVNTAAYLATLEEPFVVALRRTIDALDDDAHATLIRVLGVRS